MEFRSIRAETYFHDLPGRQTSLLTFLHAFSERADKLSYSCECLEAATITD